MNYFSYSSVYFETYGCQMNVNDTEIAWSILQKRGYERTAQLSEVKTHHAAVFSRVQLLCWTQLSVSLCFQADVVLLVTCSIRWDPQTESENDSLDLTRKDGNSTQIESTDLIILLSSPTFFPLWNKQFFCSLLLSALLDFSQFFFVLFSCFSAVHIFCRSFYILAFIFLFLSYF